MRKKITLISLCLLTLAIIFVSYFYYQKQQKIKYKAFFQTEKQSKVLMLDSIQKNKIYILNYELIKTNLQLKKKFKSEKKTLLKSLKQAHADYEIKLLEILTDAQKQNYQRFRVALKKKVIKEKIGKMFKK